VIFATRDLVVFLAKQLVSFVVPSDSHFGMVVVLWLAGLLLGLHCSLQTVLSGNAITETSISVNKNYQIQADPGTAGIFVTFPSLSLAYSSVIGTSTLKLSGANSSYQLSFDGQNCNSLSVKVNSSAKRTASLDTVYYFSDTVINIQFSGLVVLSSSYNIWYWSGN
jgi:hypothetical protein